MRKIIPLKELPLSDNFMFGAVMSDPEVCKPFLEAVLQKKIVSVQSIHKEEAIANYPGLRGVRLDVYVIDEDGVRYDVEMQGRSYSVPYLEQRTRFYQGSIDRDFLKSGEDYENLPKSYVIFVCNFDYYGAGYACYERVSHIKDCPEIAYDDGSHAIFFNTHYEKVNVSREIQEFLDYVRTNDDNAPLGSELAQKAREKVQEVRNSEKWEVEYMTMQMYVNEKCKEAKEEGKLETQIMSIRAVADVLSPAEISKRFNLSLEFVQQVLSGKVPSKA